MVKSVSQSSCATFTKIAETLFGSGYVSGDDTTIFAWGVRPTTPFAGQNGNKTVEKVSPSVISWHEYRIGISII